MTKLRISNPRSYFFLVSIDKVVTLFALRHSTPAKWWIDSFPDACQKTLFQVPAFLNRTVQNIAWNEVSKGPTTSQRIMVQYSRTGSPTFSRFADSCAMLYYATTIAYHACYSMVVCQALQQHGNNSSLASCFGGPPTVRRSFVLWTTKTWQVEGIVVCDSDNTVAAIL